MRDNFAVPGTLYLLHFDRPLGDPSRPRASAQHYLGWTNGVSVEQRLSEHAAGRGARITAAAVRTGISWTLVWQQPGTRYDERRIKNNGHHADRCPICQTKKECRVY